MTSFKRIRNVLTLKSIDARFHHLPLLIVVKYLHIVQIYIKNFIINNLLYGNCKKVPQITG